MSSFLPDDEYKVLVAELFRVLRMRFLAQADLENLVVGELALYRESLGAKADDVRLFKGSVFMPRLERLVEALVELEPDVTTGKVEPDQIMMIMGNVGDIWSETMKSDAERDITMARLHVSEMLGRK